MPAIDGNPARWPSERADRIDDHPVGRHEWNTIAHLEEYGGHPEARPRTATNTERNR
ncbi:hypothetical protein GCM10022225_33400 [Plantactinospora mayteni]|uniref:Uncharacterized protein n=1 Tax=Plantactinospora mayteni TaxID=566021 RepID=A0ABQ4EL68_9ACTN|nr:hypothetical protein Pma05_20700 [Plantactinospora mayteni]